jgi:membrane protein DedA with SNARE-associated domain
MEIDDHESGVINNKSSSASAVNNGRRLMILRLLALLIVIGISVFIFSIRDRAAEWAVFGYPGIFVVSFLAYATVLLPAPGVAFVYGMGSILNPLYVGLAAGAGGALGEISGYLAGFSGQAVVERKELYERLTRWMKKNGPLTVLFLSAIPNPFFDLAGIAAGMLKMPVRKFLFWVWIGVTIKMLLFSYAGFYSIEWISGLVANDP